MIAVVASFLVGLISYSVYAVMTYNDGIRNASWYVYFCLVCALISNLAWILITKRIDPSKIFLAGLGWDLMLVCVQAGVPIALGVLPFRPGIVIGVALVAAGMVTVNYSLRG